MILQNIYTSVACNRTPECADWGINGWILYGASNAVAIYEPKFNGDAAKVLYTYVRHSKRVNAVQWLRTTSTAKEVHFLSGADDGLALFWNITNVEEPTCVVMKGHESGVNALSALQRPNGDFLIGTAAADCTLRLWLLSDGIACECLQVLHLSEGFCFALRLTQLPWSEQVLLAFSTADETISLWAQQADEAHQFQRVHKLRGHEDWVRGLDFVREGDDLLLASCAQDNFIRLWRISARTETEVQANKVDIFNMLAADSGDIRVEENMLELGANTWCAISLESVLYGHDGWVYSVHWHQSKEQGLRLLSASIDKTIIIWALATEGVWSEQLRVGDVGGNSLGFFGAKFASDGRSILGHGYQGGFHVWHQSPENEYKWTPGVVAGGHFGEVRDLSWEPQGAYLMSVSADQTTRIHAPWQRTDKDSESTWHEIARPQVHGYDMQALAILSRYKFASGAEEKIVRTFQASINFIENFRRLTLVQNDLEGDLLLETLPKGASVPSLGLSNKAVFELEKQAPVERHVKDEYPESYFVPVTLERPPQEETLMQNTLWPEVQKLYGHGYEIYALSASADGRLLASSCRASNAEHAQIILWNTADWSQLQKLPAHQLTITQLSFSPDNRRLLSVSRDRRWCLFERQQTNAENKSDTFALIASTDKTNGVHARIIWACDWAHNGQLFATSSREGKAVIWAHSSTTTENTESSLNGWHALAVLELKNESITALAFAKKTLPNGAYVVALGFESGPIQIYQFADKWTLLLRLDNSQSHHKTVRRLQFRADVSAETSQFQLASCGDDNFVRIYELIL